MEEVWKDVPGWEGYYEVSNFGRARNARTKKFKPHDINNYGYARLQCYNGKHRAKPFIHKLVALLFVEGFVKDFVVNHKDGDKLNNVFTNLEWVSKSDNDIHAYAVLGRDRKRKDTPVKLVTSDNTVLFFNTICDCGRAIGIDEKRLHHLMKTQDGKIPEIKAHISKCVSND